MVYPAGAQSSFGARLKLSQGDWRIRRRSHSLSLCDQGDALSLLAILAFSITNKGRSQKPSYQLKRRSHPSPGICIRLEQSWYRSWKVSRNWRNGSCRWPAIPGVAADRVLQSNTAVDPTRLYLLFALSGLLALAFGPRHWFFAARRGQGAYGAVADRRPSRCISNMTLRNTPKAIVSDCWYVGFTSHRTRRGKNMFSGPVKKRFDTGLIGQ